MSKVKSPFISLGAQGTISDTLTYQKRNQGTIVREKPIPTDPYSLAQAYQRWDYRDYAYLWTLLSNSEKQVYRTKASRYHITGFSLWMREHLKTLPDIAGRWHLDERTGTIAFDSSRNNNDGVIFGASPAAGLIDGGYYFDGLNDYINCGDDPTTRLTSAISLDLFVKPHTIPWPTFDMLISKGPENYEIYGFSGTDELRSTMTIASVVRNLDTVNADLTAGFWHHLAMTFDGTTWCIYIDGLLNVSTIAFTGTIGVTPRSLLIGTRPLVGLFAKATIDNPTIYNRALDPTEVLRHSKRRYPA